MSDLDRAKVVKGLEDAYRVIEDYVPSRYRGYSRLACCDAIALLREQEPVLVEHKKVNDEYQAIEDEFVCKHCGAWWMIPEEDLKYCPGCGRRVDWPDEVSGDATD